MNDFIIIVIIVDNLQEMNLKLKSIFLVKMCKLTIIFNILIAYIFLIFSLP